MNSPMQVSAHLRRLRMSPRKVRVVADTIRGLDVRDADAQLAHTMRAAAPPIRKLLASAVANAEHNHTLDRSNLFVNRITVDQGATLKRYQPKAFGRATTIRKRSSHITVVLDERVPTASSAAQRRAPAIAAPVAVGDRRKQAEGAPGESRESSTTSPSTDRASTQPWKYEGKKGMKRGFLSRFFNRRSGER